MELANLSAIIEKECGLWGGDKLIVGVSGGPDSLALLDILTKLEFIVYVCHFNHELRGDAAKDLLFVEEIARHRNLTFVSGSGNTKQYSEIEGLSIEEAARKLRYRFLFGQAEKLTADAVVVGHNANDQVETVLMHLLRGSGLDGLVGLRPKTFTEFSDKIPLVRPMLGVWREDIVKYCKEYNLAPLEDESNRDIKYFRNRLRYELIPQLGEYNPNIKNLIHKMSNTISADQEILESLVDEFLDTNIIEQSRFHVAFDRDNFNSASLGIKRRVLRRAISLLRPGLRDIGFEAVDLALGAILDPPRSSKISLPAGLKIELETDRILLSEWSAEHFRPEWPQVSPDRTILFSVPGSQPVGEEWVVRSEILGALSLNADVIFQNANLFIAYLDFSKTGHEFSIRGRRPGDRFLPLGMDGKSIKISDFMVNAKLPRRARNNWPLVFSGGRLVWVPGYQVSDLVMVDEATTEVVKISVVRQKNSD